MWAWPPGSLGPPKLGTTQVSLHWSWMIKTGVRLLVACGECDQEQAPMLPRAGRDLNWLMLSEGSPDTHRDARLHEAPETARL